MFKKTKQPETPKIEVVEVDFTNATLFFPSDSAEEFRDTFRLLFSTLDAQKTAIVHEELKASSHWPKCAMVSYMTVDESESCYL